MERTFFFFEQLDHQQRVIVEENSLVNMAPSEFEQLAFIKKEILIRSGFKKKISVKKKKRDG